MTLIDRISGLRTRLPAWMQDWLEIAIPVLQILLIVLVVRPYGLFGTHEIERL